MPLTTCDTCGSDAYRWSWTEAFDKFGFNDGDGQVETWQVEAVLVQAGYDVEVQTWGLHNTVIVSIKRDGKDCIPDGISFGYDDPRGYLPAEIVDLLDRHLPD
jgi:hypothetical protein